MESGKRFFAGHFVAIFIMIAASVWADTHYVDPTGSNTPPYTTPATAAHSIQDAIDAAIDGDVIDIAASTYTENIDINKRLTMDGAGSGSNPATNTVIAASIANHPTIQIQAEGSSETVRLVVQDLYVTGATGSGNTGSGIEFDAGSGSYTTLENITTTGNTGNGIATDIADGFMNYDLRLIDCDMSSNGSSGFNLNSTDSFDGLTITDCHADNNSTSQGLHLEGPITGLDISGGTYNGNGDTWDDSGIWIGLLNSGFGSPKANQFSNLEAKNNGRGVFIWNYGGPSLTFDGVTVEGNTQTTYTYMGAIQVYNRDVILTTLEVKNSYTNNNAHTGIYLRSYNTGGDITTITVDNVEAKNNGYYGLYLSAGSQTVSSGSVTSCDISDNDIGLRLRYAISSFSITNNDILNNTTTGILLENGAAAGVGNAANNNNIVGNGTGIDNTETGFLFDAECNWWGSINGPTHADNTFNVGSQGETVSDDVDYVAWLDAAYPGGACTIGPVTNLDTGTTYSSYTTAHDDAATLDGHTLEGISGTYTENVVVTKKLTLDGAGSGGDPASNTIIQSATTNTPVIQISAEGTSAGDRLIVSDLRLTGASGTPGNSTSGIEFIGGSGSFTTIQNVTSIGNAGDGIATDINDGTVHEDLRLIDCNLIQNGQDGFNLNSTDTFSGLTITDCHADNNTSGQGLYLEGPITGLDLSGGTFDGNGDVGIHCSQLNNVTPKTAVLFDGFTANGNKRGLIINKFYGAFTVSNAIISNNTEEGIAVAPGASVSDLISFNTVTAENNPKWNLWFICYLGHSITNVTIDNCTFTGSTGAGNGYGVYLYSSTNSTLSNVSVTNSTVNANNNGFYLRAYNTTSTLTNVSISQNDIKNNIATGILITDVAAAGNAAHNNNIEGNGTGVTNNDPDDQFDAECNWWGTANGPTHADNYFNIGSQGDVVSDNVDYVPWLSATYPGGACTGPVWNTTTGEYFSGIQAAHDAATTLDCHTLWCASGTYTEQITITKSIELMGNGETTTFIKAPATRTKTATVSGSTWDYIVAAVPTSGTIDARIGGFSIDADGQAKTGGTAGIIGVLFNDVDGAACTHVAGLFDCTIKGFTTTAYESWGVRVFGNSVLTMNENTLTDYTRDGIVVNGDGGAGPDPVVYIWNNTLTGSAIPLNGIQVGKGAWAELRGNTVKDHTRSSPWAAVGIFVFQSDGVDVGFGNRVENCFYGIVVDESDGCNVHENTLQDNIAFHISLDDADNNDVYTNTITGTAGGSEDKAIGLNNGATGNTIGGALATRGNDITLATSGSGLLYCIYLPGAVGPGSNTIQHNTILGGKRSVQIDGGNTGTTTVRNNTIGNAGPSFAGVYLNAGSADIQDNTFTNSVRPIEFWGATNVSITGNTIDGSTYDAINCGSASGTITVSGNTVYNLPDWQFGVHGRSGADNIDIAGNEIYECHRGIGIESGCTGVQITNNNIHDNGWAGIELHETVAVLTGNTLELNKRGIETWNPQTANNNNILSHMYGGVILHHTGPHDFSCNWWGSVNGPIHADNTYNVGSQGSSIVDNGNPVDYIQWLTAVYPGGACNGYAVQNLNTGELFSSIQTAHDAANTLDGHVLGCRIGTFTEDIAITKNDLELRPLVAGSAVTIKGVANVPTTSWPLAVPNIDVIADGFTIHGFTIQGPNWETEKYTSGMVVGGDNVEIYDNDFEVTNAFTTKEVSQGIKTRRDVAGQDLNGLNIHDNNFTNHGPGPAGYEAIFINHVTSDPTPAGAVTIADNTFGGSLLRGITTERSNVTIDGNQLVTDLAPGVPGEYQGINVRDYGGREQANVLITGNTIQGSGTGKGFAEGIRFGDSGQDQHDIVATGNTIGGGNASGVVVKSMLTTTGVAITSNTICGNSVGIDATGITGALPLNAEDNWWCTCSGPYHDPKNLGGGGDPVIASGSDDVDFFPWQCTEAILVVTVDTELHEDRFGGGMKALDVDGDGVIGPGDVLLCVLDIWNYGGVPATDVNYTGSYDYTSVMIDSVNTTQGTVISGNNPGDSEISVDLGTILPDGTAQITYLVVIDEDLPLEVTEITHTGFVSSNETGLILAGDIHTQDGITRLTIGQPMLSAYISETMIAKPDSQFNVCIEIDSATADMDINSVYGLLIFDSILFDTLKVPTFEGTLLDSSGWDLKWHFFPGALADTLELFLIGGGNTAEGLVGKGSIICWELRVLDDIYGMTFPGDTASIRFVKFWFNEGTPEVETENGFFTVNRLPVWMTEDISLQILEGVGTYCSPLDPEQDTLRVTMEAVDIDPDSLRLYRIGWDAGWCGGAHVAPDSALRYWGEASWSVMYYPDKPCAGTYVDTFIVGSTWVTSQEIYDTLLISVEVLPTMMHLFWGQNPTGGPGPGAFTHDGDVTVPDTTDWHACGTVEIPVWLCLNQDYYATIEDANIGAINLILDYDPALTVGHVGNAGLVTEDLGAFTYVVDEVAGVICAGMAFNADLYDPEVDLCEPIMYVEFSIPAGVQASNTFELSIDHVKLNEGTPSVCWQYGYIHVINYSVSGIVTMSAPSGIPVPDVNMHICSEYPCEQDIALDTTDINGEYGFTPLLACTEYCIVPTKAAINEPQVITSHDASMILRSLCGQIIFTHDQELAADVTCNGEVSAFDAAVLLKWIVGIDVSSCIGQWIFEYTGSEPGYAGLDHVCLSDLNAEHPNEDFQAAVRGDVSMNWSPTLPKMVVGDAPAMVFLGREVILKLTGEVFSATLELVGVSVRNVIVPEGLQMEWYSADGVTRIAVAGSKPVADAIITVVIDSGLRLELYGSINEVPFATRAEKIPAIPAEFSLAQNYPNPFNPETNIEFGLPEDAQVKVTVFNVLGQVVIELLNTDMPAGYHVVIWNAGEISSGIYFYQIQAGTFTATKRMVLMK